MSRIFKAGSVQIDKNNRVIVDVNNYDFISKTNEKEYIPHIEEVEDKYTSNVTNEELAEKIISNAQVESEEIINNAKLEANDIIEKAKLEAENIYSERYNVGYDNGYESAKEEAYNDAKNEVTSMKNEASKILEEAKEEKEKILNDLEPQVVELVYNIVEDLVKTEMKYDNTLILSLVKEGINSTTILEKITIKLSDVDYDLVVEEKEELEKLIDSSKELKIIKDFTLQNNDCIIETDFGYVNCSIDDKLKTLKKNLELILKSR